MISFRVIACGIVVGAFGLSLGYFMPHPEPAPKVVHVPFHIAYEMPGATSYSVSGCAFTPNSIGPVSLGVPCLILAAAPVKPAPVKTHSLQHLRLHEAEHFCPGDIFDSPMCSTRIPPPKPSRLSGCNMTDHGPYCTGHEHEIIAACGFAERDPCMVDGEIHEPPKR